MRRRLSKYTQIAIVTAFGLTCFYALNFCFTSHNKPKLGGQYQKLQHFPDLHDMPTDFLTRDGVNIISYSLYGDDPRYIRGAVANANLYRTVFPGWKMRVYHDSSVPTDILRFLAEAQVELLDMSGSDMNPMNWRFLATSDEGVDRVCSRDIDSRLTFREYLAVSEWQQSNFKAHVIRDHPSHTVSRCEMPGGMWCATRGTLSRMEYLISSHNTHKHFNADQEFLKEKVWPIIQDEAMQHVSFDCRGHQNVRHLLPRVGMEHVGAVYIDGELRESDVILLREAILKGQEC